MPILHNIVGNELGDFDLGVGTERDSLIHLQRNLLRGAFAVGASRIDNQLIEFAGAAVARLVKAHALVNQRIVDDDLFAGNLAPVVHDGQLRPIFFGRAVGIGVFAGVVAADREGEGSRAAIAQFDLVAGASGIQGYESVPDVKRVHDA